MEIEPAAKVKLPAGRSARHRVGSATLHLLPQENVSQYRINSGWINCTFLLILSLRMLRNISKLNRHIIKSDTLNAEITDIISVT